MTELSVDFSMSTSSSIAKLESAPSTADLVNDGQMGEYGVKNSVRAKELPEIHGGEGKAGRAISPRENG